MYILDDQYSLDLLKQIQGESDLHYCESHEVCNIIHNRFWMTVLTERLCHCPSGRECPWQWMQTADNLSVSLNNRSVLKVSKILQLLGMLLRLI